MNDFMKTILNAIQSWTKKEIKNSTSDWNQNDVNQPGYVKNRTHWDTRVMEEITITFDGSLDGKEYIQTSDNEWRVKVSDYIPTTEEFLGGKIVSAYGQPDAIEYYPYEELWEPEYVDGVYYFDAMIAFVPSDISADGFTDTKGTWFYLYEESDGALSYISELSYTTTTGELKKIDEKYLPEIDISSKMDKNNPVGTGSFSMGRRDGSIIGSDSHAEGYDTVASESYSHAEGKGAKAQGFASHAEGGNTTASGMYSHAEGGSTSTSSSATATTTTSTTAGYCSHAEGYGSVAKGAVSHAEGNGTTASGQYSHSEGYSTTASGKKSHAEGSGTTASADTSHAEGSGTTASAAVSHAEGYKTTASGSYSHAEGDRSMASGNGSHAEGTSTIAEGTHSHAEGRGTTARGNAQHVQGEYNVLDTQGGVLKRGKYANIVGNGTSDTARSNAHTLDWYGNAWFQGDVYVGSTSGTNMDDGSKKLATEEYVSTLVGDTNVATQISNAISELNTLPAVTTADNGKVLMVVDGAWKLVQLNLSVDANGVVSVG